MNFSLPLNEDQTRIKVVKKEDLAARREGKKALTDGGSTASEEVRSFASHLNITTQTPGQSASPAGGAMTATVIPVPKTTTTKVQLVEVEPGIYDIYFTCSCCEEYVIRCESLEKAAKAPVPPSS